MRPAPWLEPNLDENQRAAAFFPEVGLQGDAGDLADAFRQHAAEAKAAATSDINILLAQIDFLTEVHGEDLDPEDAALVAQIRADYPASDSPKE